MNFMYSFKQHPSLKVLVQHYKKLLIVDAVRKSPHSIHIKKKLNHFPKKQKEENIVQLHTGNQKLTRTFHKGSRTA